MEICIYMFLWTRRDIYNPGSQEKEEKRALSAV